MKLPTHALATTEHTSPIQWITVGELDQIPAPLIRVTTCGLLTLDILEKVVSVDPPLARYVSLTPHQLRGRGTTPALTLLKLLVTCYARFGSRDWLMEQFCRDGELFSTVRIDNIVSLLRGLLCPPAYQDLRTHLVEHRRSSMSSRDGYQLAPYPLIWVDSDALAWQVEQAARMERFGDDSLPFWERTYQIAKRGPYLPDEMYSEWASSRRGEVQGILRQSVQALARLYVVRQGAAGAEDALLLLRRYWQEHPREEDVLRPLMELLGLRECYHEALDYYEQLCHLLEDDRQQPDSQTQDVAAYLRTKQLHRIPSPLSWLVAANVPVAAQQHIGTLASPTLPIDGSVQPLQGLVPSTFAQLLPLEMATDDKAAWVGIRSAHIMSLIHQWSKHTTSYAILQGLLNREIAMFDILQDTFGGDAFVLSRRQALISLAALPTMFASLLQAQPFALVLEEFLPQCAASITACWHLARGKEFLLVEKLLTHYLPTLSDLAHQPTIYQAGAANLASQGSRLMAILALHRNNPFARTAYQDQAIHFAELASAPDLLTAALISRAYYDNDPVIASMLYQRGLALKEQLSPLILSKLYAELAVESARQAQETEALAYIQLAQQSYPSDPEHEPAFLYAEFSPASLTKEKGFTYLTLAQHDHSHKYGQRAWDTFTEVGNSQVSPLLPTRVYYEIVNYQAGAALALKDLDAFCLRLEQGIAGAKLLQSEQRRQEALLLYKNARTLWPDEAQLHPLADLFL